MPGYEHFGNRPESQPEIPPTINKQANAFGASITASLNQMGSSQYSSVSNLAG